MIETLVIPVKYKGKDCNLEVKEGSVDLSIRYGKKTKWDYLSWHWQGGKTSGVYIQGLYKGSYADIPLTISEFLNILYHFKDTENTFIRGHLEHTIPLMEQYRIAA